MPGKYLRRRRRRRRVYGLSTRSPLIVCVCIYSRTAEHWTYFLFRGDYPPRRDTRLKIDVYVLQALMLFFFFFSPFSVIQLNAAYDDDTEIHFWTRGLFDIQLTEEQAISIFRVRTCACAIYNWNLGHCFDFRSSQRYFGQCNPRNVWDHVRCTIVIYIPTLMRFERHD